MTERTPWWQHINRAGWWGCQTIRYPAANVAETNVWVGFLFRRTIRRPLREEAGR